MPHVFQQAASVRPPRLSDLLTTVRREAERRLGFNNLELPVSQLCETESFAWFVCSLLSDPQRTHLVYNEVVAEYRRVNHVRNCQHPVPDLMTWSQSDAIGRLKADWLEFPFWIWRAGDSRRGRLFVRVTSAELQLADQDTVIASLPRPDASTVVSTVAQLRDLSSRGWKLRPRALTMTLFARIFLADAFLHGIGGAKYDEMTDRLIARLFGVAPPNYLIATATQHVPLEGWNVTPSDVATLKQRLWDFDHTPERHLQFEGVPSPLAKREETEQFRSEFAALLAEKQRLIAEQHGQDTLDRHDPCRASRAENNQRRRRLRTISQRLATLASETRSALTAELQAAQTHLAANTILQSREFSFCLFSIENVRSLKQATNQEA